ncbi:general secretion pathway protein GspD [Nitrogeniibacter mangrovi]|uniref:General secretion pathway protein GspD n=1 Tax=Nitrogeniibacter mangrovi TaxID=2016596 RepID=A0A6C1AXW9_9RHOO|nr:secretin N-terminal domain-containing protein [Nitrogeniibacter mangrovi]QID16202.1 general secretion pathway protein GspD [Nitrogeniibacter mangrovi]
MISLLRFLSLLVLVGLLGACASNRALESARSDFSDGDPVAALARLSQQVAQDPDNRELRTYYLNQRERLVLKGLAGAERMARAGQTEEAGRLYDEILGFAPDEPRALRGKAALKARARHAAMLDTAEVDLARKDTDAAMAAVRQVLTEDPLDNRARTLQRRIEAALAAANPPPAHELKGPFSRPVTLEFRDAPLRTVFEALSRAAGINFVFDRDVRPEAKVTLFVRDTTVDEVLRLLTATQKIESKLLNANSVLIYPATPAKTKEYRELVTRTFYLANADVKQAQSLIRQLVKIRDVFIDEKLKLLVVKDTPEAVALAEQLIKSLDVAEPEVMLEVEVLEVSRNKVRELGLDLPDQIGYGALDGSGVARALADGVVDLRSRGGLRPYIANPAVLLNLRQEDSDTSLLANPRIRVKNNEEAKIHIGDKLPVFTTTATANVGVSASVSYLDVGLKLDVKPVVMLDDDVEIKVDLEVSNIVKEVTGPSASLAYQVGTRTAGTVLRLHDGETQILAGLLQDEERSVGNGLPGVSDLPVIGRLFSSKKDTNNRTEIVLLITPRVIRNVAPPQVARALVPAGTEADVGAAPLTLHPTAANSLGLSGDRSPVSSGAALSRIFRAGQRALRATDRDPDPSEPGDAPADEAAASDGDSAEPPVPVGPLSIRVSGPSQVRAGDNVDVSIQVSGGGDIEGGKLGLRYDPGRIEAPGARIPGLLEVDLPSGQDDVTATATFLTKPGTIGTVAITPVSATVQRGGKTEQVAAGGGVNVSIAP